MANIWEKAKSILAGGQSGDPNSPHFDDQISLYADHSFKEVSFYREDVEAQAKIRYQPGSRWKGKKKRSNEFSTTLQEYLVAVDWNFLFYYFIGYCVPKMDSVP